MSSTLSHDTEVRIITVMPRSKLSAYFFVVHFVDPRMLLRWNGHVLRKEDIDWVKKHMELLEYEVEDSRARDGPKRTWRLGERS